jgi:hypothetical protein
MQRLLLFRRPPAAEGDLYEDRVLAPRHPQVSGIRHQVAGSVLADRHKAVVLRNLDPSPKRLIHGIGQSPFLLARASDFKGQRDEGQISSRMSSPDAVKTVCGSRIFSITR